MAVEYNRWTADRKDYEQLAQELTEILSHGKAKYVQYELMSDRYPHIRIGFDENNYVKLSYETSSQICRAGSEGRLGPNNASGFKALRYYAKENGELLLSSVGTSTSCIQLGIGPCADGKWGIAITYAYSSSSYYDYIDMLGVDEPATIHNMSNGNTPAQKRYLVMRNAIRYDDILFNNLYFNCYGYADSWSVIQLNGERYAVGNRGTTQNINLLMKL